MCGTDLDAARQSSVIFFPGFYYATENMKIFDGYEENPGHNTSRQSLFFEPPSDISFVLMYGIL